MPFLYEKLDTIREIGAVSEIPSYIQDNISSRFELRPYQIGAFENFITYFENDKLCRKPTQTLFHMATGSGKTMIMAGLMLYLYQKGYRNFLFFVNLSNIVNKTKENFLNSLSTKYLFAEEIRLNGERIPIKEVSNFQYADENAINICFTTTQGLHTDMWFAKENALSLKTTVLNLFDHDIRKDLHRNCTLHPDGTCETRQARYRKGKTHRFLMRTGRRRLSS